MAEAEETQTHNPEFGGGGDQLSKLRDIMANAAQDAQPVLEQVQGEAPRLAADETSGDEETDPLAEVPLDGIGIDSDEEGRGADNPGTLSELAEVAGVSPEAIYELNIGLGEGQAATLGELKDFYKDHGNLATEREAFEDYRTTSENELLKARSELQLVLNMLPELPPELLQRAASQLAQHEEKQHRDIASIRKEWADPAGFQRAQGIVSDFITEHYGFERSDVALASQDARLFKLLYDFAEMHKRVSEANAARKRQVPRSKGKQRRSAERQPARKPESETQAMTDAARNSNDPNVKARAVAALLNNQG